MFPPTSRSAPHPVPTPDGTAVPGAGTDRGRLDGFADPATRLLLCSDGLTTPLLEAWVGAGVSVREMSTRLVRAGEAPTESVELLAADPDEVLLERRSVLASSAGVDLSRNVVLARCGLTDAVERCLTDGSATIGRLLREAGTGHRRTIVEAGLGSWGGQPAAFKTYVLWHGDQPLATVTELFNPEVVPAALRSVPALAGRS
ncbi:hypothetical protein ACIQUQ_20740 [Streptomyces sp. NPDC101118]|uniref:hypothetical protein n=1 Tax=Streptomyces sp. NPDC101118 TaxID=3366109 RepID=UPI00381AC5B0